MAVFERLIRNYFVDQGSPSKLEAEILDAIERLDDINSTLCVTAMDDEFVATRAMTLRLCE